MWVKIQNRLYFKLEYIFFISTWFLLVYPLYPLFYNNNNNNKDNNKDNKTLLGVIIFKKKNYKKKLKFL